MGAFGLVAPASAQVSITDFKPKATEVDIKKSTTLSWTSVGVADLTPDFSTTGRLVKSDFQGEIGHEEVEIH
jgi:hypothetical protein